MRSTQVSFGPLCPLKLYSINLVLSSPLWSYSVHSIRIGPIRSTLVLFCPLRSYSVHFDPIRFILSILVHLSPIQSILSTSAFSFHIGPIQSIMSTLVLICSFILIQSTLVLFDVLFGPLQSYSVHFVPFGPIRYILIHFDPLFVHLHNEKIYVWVESTYSKSKFINCNIGKYIFVSII